MFGGLDKIDGRTRDSTTSPARSGDRQWPDTVLLQVGVCAHGTPQTKIITILGAPGTPRTAANITVVTTIGQQVSVGSETANE